MTDRDDVQSDVLPVDLSSEVGRSLGSVWTRYFGGRPPQAETQIAEGVVRWVLADGTAQFERGMAAGSDEAPPDTARTLAGFRRDTSEAVTRATHRKVVAMMSAHDSKTGVATETFILEAIQRKY